MKNCRYFYTVQYQNYCMCNFLKIHLWFWVCFIGLFVFEQLQMVQLVHKCLYNIKRASTIHLRFTQSSQYNIKRLSANRVNFISYWRRHFHQLETESVNFEGFFFYGSSRNRCKSKMKSRTQFQSSLWHMLVALPTQS